jgi:hypothetical protein
MRRYARDRLAMSEAKRQVEKMIRTAYPEAKPADITKLSALYVLEAYRNIIQKKCDSSSANS